MTFPTLSFVDRVIFNAANDGTASFVESGAVKGYQTMEAAGAVNGTQYGYAAQAHDLTSWEVGYGTWTTVTKTLTRTVLFNSSGTAVPVSFDEQPQVMITALAESLPGPAGPPGPAGVPSGYIKLSDFGVVGNGSTDDTTALNTAFASLAGSSGTVIWDVGFCKTTGTVIVGNATGGAGAATSFISIIAPKGNNGSGIFYNGPTNGIALLFAKNKQFVCQGINVSNQVAVGTTTGMLLGGSGTGAFGTQTLNAVFIDCAVGGFHFGIKDGNFGASSEITWINLVLANNDTGWISNDFNTLDHIFICPSLGANGVGLDTGAAEGYHVFGGSSSVNAIDFQVGSANGYANVTSHRSEGATTSNLNFVAGGVGRLRGCNFLDSPLSVSGQPGQLFVRDCRLMGFVAPTAMPENMTLIDCGVRPDPTTLLPFICQSATASRPSSQPGWVCIRNCYDTINSPRIFVSDQEGAINSTNLSLGSNLLSTLLRVQSTSDSANTSQLGLGVLSLNFVKSLGEGPVPGMVLDNNLSPSPQTLTTNATTAAGNAVLHFASVPSWVVPGMSVVDATTSVLPFATLVLSATSTTVTLTATATGGGVGSGDTIDFFQTIGTPTIGNNLRIQGTFASSGTLALPFIRTLTSYNAGNGYWVAATGAYRLSDVGKMFLGVGIGIGANTDAHGWISGIVGGNAVVEPAATNVIPTHINIGSPATVNIGQNEPDANYMVFVTGNANETFWVDTIASTGFTVHSSNSSSTATVNCLIVR